MPPDEKRNGSVNGSVKTDRPTSLTDAPVADAQAADAQAAFESMAKQLADIRAFVACYFSARADALGVRLRYAAVRAFFAVGLGLGLSSVIATAAVLMVVGLADGLTVLCGDRPWAGKLAAGALVMETVRGGLVGQQVVAPSVV